MERIVALLCTDGRWVSSERQHVRRSEEAKKTSLATAPHRTAGKGFGEQIGLPPAAHLHHCEAAIARDYPSRLVVLSCQWTQASASLGHHWASCAIPAEGPLEIEPGGL